MWLPGISGTDCSRTATNNNFGLLKYVVQCWNSVEQREVENGALTPLVKVENQVAECQGASTIKRPSFRNKLKKRDETIWAKRRPSVGMESTQQRDFKITGQIGKLSKKAGLVLAGGSITLRGVSKRSMCRQR